MIVRNYPQRTLKASPLSNRSVRRTCGQIAIADSTLEECPNNADGRLFQSRFCTCFFSGGALRTARLLSVDAFSVLYGFMRIIIYI